MIVPLVMEAWADVWEANAKGPSKLMRFNAAITATALPRSRAAYRTDKDNKVNQRGALHFTALIVPWA